LGGGGGPLLTSCSKKQVAADEDRVVVNYTTFSVGTHLSAPIEREVFKRFNDKYGKEIRLVVEELPSDSAYNDKMKVLVVSGGLPDVVDGKDGLRDILIQSGNAVDLRPYLDSDPDFREWFWAKICCPPIPCRMEASTQCIGCASLQAIFTTRKCLARRE
jgi:ABC-type glycerol-3-phosphate transport system substrate-binding protein